MFVFAIASVLIYTKDIAYGMQITRPGYRLC